MKQEYDVVIFGGGPAGSTLAISLCKLGYSVALIEKSSYETVRIGETLMPEIYPVLSRLGIKEDFLQEEHSPFYAVQSAWGKDDLYTNDFILSPYGNGWQINRKKFDYMLAEKATASGAILYRDSKLQHIRKGQTNNEWEIQIVSAGQKQDICARYIADATGKKAVLSHQLGVKRKNYDHLIGAAVLFDTSNNQGSSQNLLIESSKNGWWYSALLPDNKLIVVYMTDADLYAKGNKKNKDYWELELKETMHTSKRVQPHFTRNGNWVFAANSSIAENIEGSNWLPVGDAFMSFDPLSSRGISAAMCSGIDGADFISTYFHRGKYKKQEYFDSAREKYTHYLQLRRNYYLNEQRWHNCIFWERRHKEVLI